MLNYHENHQVNVEKEQTSYDKDLEIGNKFSHKL